MTIVKIPKRISEYPIYCLLLEIYIFSDPFACCISLPIIYLFYRSFFTPYTPNVMCILPNQAAIGHPSRTLKPPSTTLCYSVVFAEKKQRHVSETFGNGKLFYFTSFSASRYFRADSNN